jgi:Rrf2 family iron-sulfur cluster assembly transcriptional regulator
MIHVTMWSEYGIHCCIYLAEIYPHQSSAARIAESLGIEVAYTHQILHKLRQAQIVESTRGPRGGYGLARDALSISIFDILMAVEGDSFQLICESRPIGEHCGASSGCGLHQIWYELRGTIEAFLRKHTIDSLRGRDPLIGTLVNLPSR